MNAKKVFFLKNDGSLRTGWLIGMIIGLYIMAVSGVYFLYWTSWRALMEIWGVTGQNYHRAPGAIRLLYSWSNVIVTLVQNALLMIAGKEILKRAGICREKDAWIARSAGRGIGLGAVCMIFVWGFLLVTGSIRLGWRLSQPKFSVNTLALLMTALATSLGEGCYLYGAALSAMKKRLPIWGARGIIVVMSVLSAGAFSPMGLLNGALTGLVCCLLAERFGIGGVAGFRFAWLYLNYAVLGFAGATAALYESYPVNLYWLNGGNAGIMSGLLVTLLLSGLAVWLLRVEMAGFMTRKSKSPS